MDTIIAFTLLQLTSLCRSSRLYLRNVECNPYVDYVQTDPLDYFRYNPFYVKLHRCHGANSIINPRNKQCLPSENGVEELEIYVVNNSNNSYQVMKVQNHTQCAETCTLDKMACSPFQTFSKEDCACICRYDKTPSKDTCKDPFYWDQSMCNCICKIDTKVCPKRREFSKDACECVCKQKFHVRCAKRKKVVDEKTCECIEPTVITEPSSNPNCTGDITIEILIMALCLEGIMIVLMYFCLYRYCYKRMYFRMKADKERESITKYEDYSSDNTEKSRPILEDVEEEEVPPFTLDSLNRNSLNRNSINRNSVNRSSANRSSVRRTSLEKIYNNNSLSRKPKVDTDSDVNSKKLANGLPPNNNLYTKEESLYKKDERSPLNQPSEDESYLYNDIEPTNYESSDLSSEFYKNISLV